MPIGVHNPDRKVEQLYGFDIQPSHFSAARDIAGNVKLNQRRVLDVSVPVKFLGSFEVVHARAFGNSVRNSGCTTVLMAAKR